MTSSSLAFSTRKSGTRCRAEIVRDGSPSTGPNGGGTRRSRRLRSERKSAAAHGHGGPRRRRDGSSVASSIGGGRRGARRGPDGRRDVAANRDRRAKDAARARGAERKDPALCLLARRRTARRFPTPPPLPPRPSPPCAGTCSRRGAAPRGRAPRREEDPPYTPRRRTRRGAAIRASPATANVLRPPRVNVPLPCRRTRAGRSRQARLVAGQPGLSPAWPNIRAICWLRMFTLTQQLTAHDGAAERSPRGGSRARSARRLATALGRLRASRPRKFETVPRTRRNTVK